MEAAGLMLVATTLATASPAPAPECFGELMCTIPLARDGQAHEWPFSVDSGELSCVRIGASQTGVIFSEVPPPEEQGEIGNLKPGRSVVVTANPVALLVSIDDRSLYAPYDSLETLITRLAPYERIGQAICPDAPAKDI